MKPVLAFTQGANHPSGRMRIAVYTKHLAARGWQLQMHHFAAGMGKSLPPTAPWWQRLGRRLDRNWQSGRARRALRQIPPDQAVIISRELPVRRHPFLNAPNPMVLDIDDALYLGGGRDRLIELCERAQVVVCGNQTIADALEACSRRCVVIPTVVDTDQYTVRADYRVAGRLRVGWLGSSMSADETLLPWLQRIGEAWRKSAFELVVISDECPLAIRGGEGMRFLKWSAELEYSIADHIDVGVMPLQNNAYQAAKCGAKVLQYMAAGLPVVASPLGVNCEIIIPGVTGFLADDTNSWIESLRMLAEQETLRRSMGQAGRERVVEHYSVARWAGPWASLLDEISA